MLTRRAVAFGLATTILSLTQARARSHPNGDPLAGDDLAVSWTAKPQPRKLRSDASEEADLWTFNGQLAPSYRIKQGTEFRLSLKNETSAPLSLHWHGVRAPNAMDGVGGLTQDPVAPGKSFDYRFTPPDAGTFLIRPCVLGASAEPMDRGLTGLLIVEEPSPPKVDQDLALLIDDWKLAEAGTLAPFEADQHPAGRLGNWLSTNGKAVPERVKVPAGGRIRLRLANACNARTLRLRFDRLKPFVIAVDGQPTDTFEPLRASLPFPPGTRYDVLIDMPEDEGVAGTVTALVGDGTALVELVTAGPTASGSPSIVPLPTNRKLPATIKLQNAARADLAITHSPDAPDKPWAINGMVGSPSMPPLFKVKRGRPVVLAIANRTPFAQPFHLHGHAFRLLHPLDDGWEPYFLDTLQVPEKRTVRIAFVADNPGKWLVASTVTERFDAGLWSWFDVT